MRRSHPRKGIFSTQRGRRTRLFVGPPRNTNAVYRLQRTRVVARPARLVPLVLIILVVALMGALVPSGTAEVDAGIWNAQTVPATTAELDDNSVVLGTRFQTSKSGSVMGVAFYKAPENIGPHEGYLWTGFGQLLAQVSFTNETQSGWQVAAFAHPVTLTPGASYVVGYLAPNGRYANDQYVFANGKTVSNGPLTGTAGVYSYEGEFPSSTWHDSAYYVDVLFRSSTSLPTATSTGSSTSPSTAVPSPPPAPTTSTGSATTSTGTGAGFTFWSDSVVPAIQSVQDRRAATVGTRFVATASTNIVGLRYYRGPANDGPHVGQLWRAEDGTLLGSVTFVDSSFGWQTARLAAPIPVSAGRSYVVSYTAPSGHYAYQERVFANGSGIVAGALTAVGGVQGRQAGMPSRAWREGAFFVDVLTSQPGTPNPTTTTTSTPSSTTPTSSTSSTTTSSSTSSSSTPSSTSPTTAPSPTSSTSTGCAARPSACGYPDASNTGVTAGVTLRASSCITASTPGQVIENVSISGCDISVTAQNVVIRNVRISLSAPTTWAIIVRQGGSARISNVEISGLDQSTRSVQYAVLSHSSLPVYVDRSDLSNCADCVQGESVVITNSYIHQLANPPGAHVDGIQCNSSCGITVDHNTIVNQWDQTAAVALFADFGTPRDSKVTNNLLVGGGYAVYGGGPAATGIVITGNRFGPSQWGPGTQFNRSGAGNIWSGNYSDTTGAVIPPP